MFTWVYKILYINYVKLIEILNLALKNSTYEEVNGGSIYSKFIPHSLITDGSLQTFSFSVISVGVFETLLEKKQRPEIHNG